MKVSAWRGCAWSVPLEGTLPEPCVAGLLTCSSKDSAQILHLCMLEAIISTSRDAVVSVRDQQQT